MVAVSVVCIAAVSCCTFLSCSAVNWLTASSAIWLCELHVGNTKGSRWLTSLRRRKESLAGSLSPQRHRVNVFECARVYGNVFYRACWGQFIFVPLGVSACMCFCLCFCLCFCICMPFVELILTILIIRKFISLHCIILYQQTKPNC